LLRKVHASWSDLRDASGVRFLCPTDEDLLCAVESEVSSEIDSLARERGCGVDEEEAELLRQRSLDALREHWSLSRILPGRLDVDALVDAVNRKVRHELGVDDDAIVDWRDDREGVWFTVTGCADVECGEDLLEAVREAREWAGLDPQVIDLSDWDDHRARERTRSRRRSRRV
jgi:hypothetical protein